MNVEREILEKCVNTYISKYARNRAVKLSIIKDFKARNLLSGDVNNIMSLRLPLSTLSDIMLLVFTNSLYQATKEPSINPEQYYTASEIKVGSNYLVPLKEVQRYPIKFNNAMFQIASDQWISFLTVQQLTDLFDRQVLIYNTESQRQTVQKFHHNQIIEQVNVNKLAVQEIESKILTNSFIPNFITLNLLQNGKDSFSFNGKDFIIKSGELNVLDGYHRCLSILQALQCNHQLEFNIGIMITNFDMDKAKRFIVQEDKKNKMNKKYIKSLDDTNYSGMIVTKINEKSYLKGKITNKNLTHIVNRNYNDYLIEYNTLLEAIEYAFNPQNTKHVVKFSNFIINELNNIIDANPNLLTNILNSQAYWIACILYIQRLYSGRKVQMPTLNFDYEPIKQLNKSYIKRLEIQMFNKIVKIN